MGRIPWAFFFFLAGAPAFAAEGDSGVTASGIPGAVTYPSGATSGKSTAPGAKPSIVVPTPDTIAPPPGLAPAGSGTPNTILSPGTPAPSLGKYRTGNPQIGITVKIDELIHDRYRQSVVRVVAKDLGGTVLAKSMGVAIGRNSGSQYIAAPLSIALGSSQQWADKIEITHYGGNKYEASIALIDEEKNLVLLSPEASPAPIVFARESNERPQIDVFTISFDMALTGEMSSAVHRGKLAAANPETGLLSVSPYAGQVIDDAQAGTGLLDSEGSLVGMLLPGGRGVLSSSLQRAIAKAQKATPLEPRMIGVILGRGVLVDPNLPGAFKTITEAQDAIKKGVAPKTDPTRYTPARNRSVAPKETDKVVIKVMPGVYKEKKTIYLGANTSLSGSGPAHTTIAGSDPDKPVILVQNAANVIVAGLRIVPALQQKLKAPALIVNNASNVTLSGNVFEAKGGVAAWVHNSRKVALYGNTFARGQVRGLSCDRTDIELEANAFLGDWPVAASFDKGCSSVVKRNLFFENKTSLNIAANAGSTLLQQNTFVRSPAAVRVGGSTNKFSLYDNIFFECEHALYVGGDANTNSLGRNGSWKSRFTARSKPLSMLDIVRTEPVFEDPSNYDFRIKPGKGHVGSALRTPGGDLGAFQRADFVGTHSGTLAHTLGAATGDVDLAGSWGLNE
ncbi:MAG TPA: right-handed parallel beta-helix repeat-containing protein [Bdellovibrionota bacterium]|jgi:hypothetical protein